MPDAHPGAVLRHAAAQAGVARRAYALAVEHLSAGDRARLPGPQFAVADMRATCDTVTALLGGRTVAAGDELGAACTVALFVDEAAERVVTTAERLLAHEPQAATELVRLRRELRATPPPVPDDRCRELVGKHVLGIDPDSTPRWL